MATSADIQKYVRNSDGYIEFIIKVVHNGREWGIKKRFSEFIQLHEYLQKNGYEFAGVLPKKKIWQMKDDAMLRQRCRGLQLYLNELIRSFSMSDNSLLKEFFEVEVNWLKHAKKNMSFYEIKSIDKIRKLPVTLAEAMIQIPSNNVNCGPGSPMASHSNSFSMSMPRSRVVNQFVRNGQILNGPSLSKSKSLSFSLRGANPNLSRKDSFQGESCSSPQAPQIRDRRFSMDIFNLSNSGVGNEYYSALVGPVKKQTFLKATEVLWAHYKDDIERICEEADELDTRGIDNPFKAGVDPVDIFTSKEIISDSSMNKPTMQSWIDMEQIIGGIVRLDFTLVESYKRREDAAQNSANDG